MCTIEPNHGDSLVHLNVINSNETIALPDTVTWFNNFTITNGTTCSTDGKFPCSECASIGLLGLD